MGMENENDNKALEPNSEHNDDKFVSSSSSSPSPSRSSTSSCEDQSINPEPQSPTSAYSSCPDMSSSTPQWSMISASPSNSARLSPPIIVQSAGPHPAGYDPSRIPMYIFGSRSNAPAEWSVASNESLFSIHMGNNSFRDHASVLVNKSGQPEDPEANKRSNNDGKNFSSTLPPVIEGGINHDEKSEPMQESSATSPKSAMQLNYEVNSSKIVASSEIHSFAMSHTASDGRGTPPATLNTPRLSDGSGTSSSSFAFPVLVNDGGNASSLKSVPEKPESEQKPQPESQSQESSKEEVPKPAETSWFSYLFCLRRCC